MNMNEKIKETILEIVKNECSKNPSIEEIAEVLSHHPLDLGLATDFYWCAADVQMHIDIAYEDDEITEEEYAQLSSYPFNYEEIWKRLTEHDLIADCRSEIFNSYIEQAKKELGI